VLVIGGTGNFGARLVEGLVATTDLDVVIAARRVAPAEALAARLHQLYAGGTIEIREFDASIATADDLRQLRIWCVADAAGPFQAATPRLIEIAVAAGCHYVDLADARDFVAGISRFDAAARAANVLVTSGASSTPALTNAALDDLTAGWQRIDRIEIALSPGNRQPRGLSVIRAILAVAGQPVRVFRNGAWQRLRAMGSLTRRRIPGLGRRWLFLADTPDLDILPARFAPRRDAVFFAGLQLATLHLGLWALSKLVALGLPSLVGFARPLHMIAGWFRACGSARGGMMVSAEGLDAEGTALVASWTLVADEDGPHVPVLPALATIRALASGRMVTRGAMPCVGLLSLSDITREFARLRTVARVQRAPRAVVRRALGGSFAMMPAPIRVGHEVADRLLLEGRGSVTGARTFPARLLARFLGFPGDAPDVPVRVEMRAMGSTEMWTREFGTARFRSRLISTNRRVLERFGPLTFQLQLTARADGLDYSIVSGRFAFLPLPSFLVPRSFAKERLDQAGRFYFDVPISLPGIGLLVHYRGWLIPASAS
jgi:Domain of unknown function (DUF4166)/Saccharopine dehydrogenase NADP binding domain